MPLTDNAQISGNYCARAGDSALNSTTGREEPGIVKVVFLVGMIENIFINCFKIYAQAFTLDVILTDFADSTIQWVLASNFKVRRPNRASSVHSGTH